MARRVEAIELLDRALDAEKRAARLEAERDRLDLTFGFLLELGLVGKREIWAARNLADQVREKS